MTAATNISQVAEIVRVCRDVYWNPDYAGNSPPNGTSRTGRLQDDTPDGAELVVTVTTAQQALLSAAERAHAHRSWLLGQVHALCPARSSTPDAWTLVVPDGPLTPAVLAEALLRMRYGATTLPVPTFPHPDSQP